MTKQLIGSSYYRRASDFISEINCGKNNIRHHNSNMPVNICKATSKNPSQIFGMPLTAREPGVWNQAISRVLGCWSLDASVIAPGRLDLGLISFIILAFPGFYDPKISSTSLSRVLGT